MLTLCTSRDPTLYFRLSISVLFLTQLCTFDLTNTILFLRNPKKRLKHCLIEFYNSLNRLHFGDVEKQCCDAGTESRLSRRFCPDFFEFRQKGSRFSVRIAAIRTCAKQPAPNPRLRDDLRVSVVRGRKNAPFVALRRNSPKNAWFLSCGMDTIRLKQAVL